MVYFRVFIFILLFPVALQAQHKFGLELVSPKKPFSMKVGKKQKIQFKAITSAGDFHYAVLLKSVGQSSKAGTLLPGLIKLRQGLNELTWDGRSFIALDEEKRTMAQLKEGMPGKYFFKILIFDSKNVKLHGKNSDAHIQAITHLRTKNFQVTQ